MTAITVILIGAGILFIASAIDCSPIGKTFMKIIGNQPIDWSGKANCPESVTVQDI